MLVAQTHNFATGQLHGPCQYGGNADHPSNACPQAKVCPTCKSKNHSLMYICQLVRDTKGQKKTREVVGPITLP